MEISELCKRREQGPQITLNCNSVDLLRPHVSTLQIYVQLLTTKNTCFGFLAPGVSFSNMWSTGRPRLTNIRPTNIRPTNSRTYEQAADMHLLGPANSCSRYEHGYAPMETQVSSTEQTTYELKFGTQPVRKLGTSWKEPMYYRPVSIVTL
jgi:hypothetical protein